MLMRGSEKEEEVMRPCCACETSPVAGLPGLAGPEPSPVFGCHVLNSKGKMPGGGSERDWADTELSLQ